MTVNFNPVKLFFMRLLSVLSAGISVISLIFSFFALGDLIAPAPAEKVSAGVLAGLLLFFLTVFAGGVWAFFFIRKKEEKGKNEREERQLLDTVRRCGGIVSPSEVAVGTELTLTEAKQKLEEYCIAGIAELQITKSGKLVYAFFGFMDQAEKENAQNVLDT